MRKYIYLIAPLLLVICMAFVSRTDFGAGISVVKILDGSTGQLKVDSVVLIQDPVFYEPAYNGKRVTPYRVQNMVSLEVNEDALIPIQTDFDATVRLLIRKTDYQNVVTQTTVDLTVNYRKDSAYKHRRSHIFANAHSVEVKVVSLTKNVSWDAFSVLKVVNQMQTFPEFTWDCSNNAVRSISIVNGGITEDELPVSWPVMPGADEYDLEWSFIDSAALAGNTYKKQPGGTLDSNRIFANNSTRVTIAATSYRIPLFYDKKGTLFFRVRSVHWSSQLSAEGGRMEANWSSDYGGMGAYPFLGHEQKINWQSTTSFAEDGKRKTVVQYYDGSLRARQTVTKDNVSNNTIVAESMYDYQGRPVIQVMPTPTLSNVIKYAKNFNVAPGGLEYDKSLYDTLGNPNGICSIESIKMESSSGASQYYSPANPNARSIDPKYRFIPDAENYPFTEVEYAQDNTGRIIRQSGVGKIFRLGGGHETVYTYGTADQNELDALFGTEVGNASHYQKNVIRDANGQYSISYVDMRGRTVATALAGALPSDVKLDTLASLKKEGRTRVLADPSSALIRGLIMESKKTITVEDDNVKHSFNYQLDPMSLQKDGCKIPATQFCYDCLYDLQITITSDCNNGKLPGGVAFDTLIRNFSLANIDTTCTNNPQPFNVNFILFLSKGTYEITKKLTVSQQAMDYYRNIFIKRNQCITLDSFANEVRKAQALGNNCAPECATCLSSLGTWQTFWAQYRLNAGIADADTLKYKDGALKDYENAIRACDDLCEKTTAARDYRGMMLGDMFAPNGQYADTSKLNDPRNIFYQNDRTDNGMLVRATAYYRQVTKYTDASGNPALVYREATGRMVPPQELTIDEFITNFEESWADSLLKFHPEYCALNYIEAMKNSNEWDRRFLATETYGVAKQSGYMNPTASTAIPFSYFSASGTADPDPVTTYLGVNFKTALESAMSNYKTLNSQVYSMQGFSAYTALCQTGSSPLCGSNTANGSYLATSSAICDADKDMAWKNFRAFYMQLKKEKVLAYLKTVCGATVASQLVAEGHIPRFANEELFSLFPGSGTPPANMNEANQQKDAKAAEAKAYYNSNCQAYVDYWISSLLSSCTLYNEADLRANVVPKLLEVCRQGADIDHQFGASTVPASSTFKYRSFQDVIQEYNLQKGITDENCNAYVITAPKPYDQPDLFINKASLKKPEDCECELINKYYSQFTNRGQGYGSFGKFMRDVYNTPVSDSAADYLVGLCNNSSTCTFLDGMISIPPAFQCGGGDICIDCNKFKTYDSTFRVLYPGVLTSADPEITDSLYIKWNILYQNYMNYRTGFVKTAKEYLEFGQQCMGLSMSLGCDSLNRILRNYEVQRKSFGVGYKTTYTNAAGNPVTLTNPLDMVREGALMLPDTVRALTSSGTTGHILSSLSGSTFCAAQGYAIEMRFKYLKEGHADNLFYFLGGRFSITFRRSGNSVVLTHLAAPEAGVDYPLNVVAYPDSGIIYNWCTVKAKVTPSLYQVYFNGKLIHSQSRSAAVAIPNFQAIGANFNSRHAIVDYYKFYGQNDTLKLSEEFNTMRGYTIPGTGTFCPVGVPDCQTAFVTYFNQQNGSSLTLKQIEALYISKCGKAPNVCGDLDSLALTLKDYISNMTPNRGVPTLLSDTPAPDDKVTDPARIMRDGIMMWEDRLQKKNNYNEYTYHRFATAGVDFCAGQGYSIETRFKMAADIFPGSGDLFEFGDRNGGFIIARNGSGTSILYAWMRNGSGGVYSSNPNILLSPKTGLVNEWNNYKVVYAGDSMQVYLNDIRKGVIRFPGVTLINVSDHQLKIKGWKGMVDWVKMRDNKGKLVYFEDFNTPEKPAGFSPSFICSALPDCQTSFVNYFNQRRNTTYTFRQIDSLYYVKTGRSLDVCGAKDTILNTIGRYNAYSNPYRFMPIQHFNDPNPVWASSRYSYNSDPDLIMGDGLMRHPDTLRNMSYGTWWKGFIFRAPTAFCTTNDYTVEIKLKELTDKLPPTAELFYYKDQNTEMKFYRSFVTSHPVNKYGFCLATMLVRNPADPTSNTFIDILPANVVFNVDPYAINKDWAVMKFNIGKSRIRIYYNDTLKVDVPRTTTQLFDNVAFNLYWLGFEGAVDYVKAYDFRGKLMFHEDFEDRGKRALIAPEFLCPKPTTNCITPFVSFYNQQRGTNYNYSQIDSLHYAMTGSYLDICGGTPMTAPYYRTLCGRSQPVFSAINATPVDNCSDSTFFIYSKAQTLYNHYVDSLYGTFDSLYLAKCMTAYKFEKFTVSDTAREYHYTLYYYDQAGNLVKTIPPAGVKPNRDPVWLANVKAARAAGNVLVPNHEFPTDYRYNALNQVVGQKSPDGGRSQFWYDRLGRLVISQNAKQRYASTTEENRLYSYTKYDGLGRITEVGQLKNLASNGAMLDTTSRTPSLLLTWMNALNQRREQVTSTIYDLPYTGFVGTMDDRQIVRQRNLRNRVSYTTYSDDWNTANYNHGTFYTYDIHGNVDTLLQDYGCGTCGITGVNNLMNQNGNRFKKISYNYDLISGKVNSVAYQKGWSDQFFHKYSYDGENRLILVETSLDGFNWEKDARYEYYLHGPLARTVLGHQQVQGVDYAYTLQGWLKGVNSAGATSNFDIGGDGAISTKPNPNRFVARDAYGFALNYFGNEYLAINDSIVPFPGYSSYLNADFRPLYNGNISSMVSTNRVFENPAAYPDSATLLFNYKYDQLNRITGMDAWNKFKRSTNDYSGLTKLDQFKEQVSYDPNGNILSYKRNSNGAQLLMDDLTYLYYPGTNRLRRVKDDVPDTRYGANLTDKIIDIDNQTDTLNYIYDSIGNLIQDKAESITNINWNVYGKITGISRGVKGSDPAREISYTYDASGNRISKTVIKKGRKSITWYVRDAQGNVMATYTGEDSVITALPGFVVNENERYIYGSSRLGVVNVDQAVDNGNAGPAAVVDTGGVFFRGLRMYELSNHLGNVLVTVSDRKKGIADPLNAALIKFFEPVMLSGTDYYPFGMPMRIGGDSSYRYGFNGKENDNEVKGGEGLQQDYGMRVYDNRIGRFLSVDPLSSNFPWNSPYSYSEGNPINYEDIDGAETGTTPNQARLPRTRPVINVTIDPNLLNGRSGGSAIPGAAPRGVFRAGTGTPSSSGTESQGSYVIPPYVSPHINIHKYIPPNAQTYDGAVYENGAVYVVGYDATGGRYKNKIAEQKVVTFVDRLVYGALMEKVKFALDSENGEFSIPNVEVGQSQNSESQKEVKGVEVEFVYRGGAFSDKNFTPRPNKDDGTGPKSGLSAFITPSQATQGGNGKVQVLNVKQLKAMGFVLTFTADGHVGIRPASQEELKEWAASRPGLDTGGTPHENTTKLKSAKVGELKVP